MRAAERAGALSLIRKVSTTSSISLSSSPPPPLAPPAGRRPPGARRRRPPSPRAGLRICLLSLPPTLRRGGSEGFACSHCSLAEVEQGCRREREAFADCCSSCPLSLFMEGRPLLHRPSRSSMSVVPSWCLWCLECAAVAEARRLCPVIRLELRGAAEIRVDFARGSAAHLRFELAQPHIGRPPLVDAAPVLAHDREAREDFVEAAASVRTRRGGEGHRRSLSASGGRACAERACARCERASRLLPALTDHRARTVST